MKIYCLKLILIFFCLTVTLGCVKNSKKKLDEKELLVGSWNLTKVVDDEYFEIYISNQYLYTFQEEVISSITKYKIRNDSIIYVFEGDTINNFGTRFKIHDKNSFSTYSLTRESRFERTIKDYNTEDYFNSRNKKEYWNSFNKRKSAKINN